MRGLLRVDLTGGTVREEEIPREVLQHYIGGKGLAAYYAYKEIPPHSDPLSPHNRLMLFIGPLTGVFGVYTRHVLAAKSPLTGTFCDSYAGGGLGAEFARTGYLGLIVEGKADRPVYLKIDKGRASLEDASSLAGKGTYDVDAMFPEYRVLSIGLAGEKLVRFACIANEGSRSTRAGIAGRGGLGAVMGSKNLKAILVRGKYGPDEFIPEEYRLEVRSLRRQFLAYLKTEVAPGMGVGGNLPAMQLTADAKILPVRNFCEGYIEGYERVTEQEFAKVSVGKTTCYLCPLACGVQIRAGSGPFAGTELERIEYETVAMNGPNCQQLDIGVIATVARLCNDYGMDTISLGNITGFLMECSAHRLVDYRLDYGDGAGQVKLVEMIARREDIGDLLAEGVKRAAETLGLQARAVHIKGMEIPGYDVRGPVGMGLAYATADRGGDHLRAWTVVAEVNAPFTVSGKASLTKQLQDRNSGLWCLIGCDNIPANTTGDAAKFTELSIRGLNALGWNVDTATLMHVGERVYNLTRLFNVREGFSRKDDALPPRLEAPRRDTGWTLARADYERMLTEYYRLRGWDEEGKPTPETRERLGLSI